MAMRTRTFDKNFMEMMLDEDAEGSVIVYTKIIDNSRWSSIHEMVFSYDGKFYKTNYSLGLTEYQDEQPWQYDEDVECVEVKPYKVEVTEFHPVPL